MPNQSPVTDSVTLQRAAWNLWHVWVVAFLAASALYISTMTPGILWGDSGQAQLRVLTGQLQDSRELARTHVTYFATASGISRLFGTNPIRTANFVSAVAGAVTVANFAVLCTFLMQGKVAIVCGACLLLFSHTLWQMSAGAEVVTFSTMFLSFELLFVIRFMFRGSFGWLALAALSNGLGWSTHNFALLIWPAYIAVVLTRPPWLADLNWRRVLGLALVWLIGVAPLAVSLLLRMDELNGTGDAMRSVFVGIYGKNVFNLRFSASMAFRVMAYVCLNFPTPILLLLPIGLWRFSKTHPRPQFCFLTVAAISFFVFAARYDVPDQYTFLTHTHMFIALFLAFGLDQFTGPSRDKKLRAFAVLLCCMAPLVYAVLPTIAKHHLSKWVKLPQRVLPYRPPYNWFLQPWRCGNSGAERYAREVLESLPQNAVLIVDSTTGRPIDLVQGTQHLRLDVRVPGELFVRPWSKPFTLERGNVNELVADGLLFCTSVPPPHWKAWNMALEYEVVPAGLVFRIIPLQQTD